MPTPQLFHGSSILLPVGTVLTPRGEAYKKDWGHCGFFEALEATRPPHALEHSNAVFACREADLDLCGGALDVIFAVEPTGALSQHDMEWGTQISCMLDNHPLHAQPILDMAQRYWSGTPSQDPVWEFLSTGFRILAVVENNL